MRSRSGPELHPGPGGRTGGGGEGGLGVQGGRGGLKGRFRSRGARPRLLFAMALSSAAGIVGPAAGRSLSRGTPRALPGSAQGPMHPTSPPSSAVSRIAVASLLAVVLLLAGPGALAAQDDRGGSSADTVRSGWYWTSVSPPGDSVTARFENRSTPLWEDVLLVPYHLVGYPIRWTVVGIQYLVEGASTETTRSIVNFFTREGRHEVRPSLKLGGLAGFGGGLTYRMDPFLWSGSRLRLRGSATVPGERRADVGMLAPLGSGIEAQLGGGFRRRHNARFFGIGPNAREKGLSVYEREELWVGAGLGVDIGGGVRTEGALVWSRIGAFPGTDPDVGPPLESAFEEIPGGFGRFSRSVSAGLAFSHEDTRNRPHPNGGGVRRISAWYLRGDDTFTPDHWSYRAELQQYFSLFSPHRVLAVRAMGAWLELDPASDGPLPFQRLLTNDEPDLLRGYEDFRWQDRGLAIVTAEYRWPLWRWSDLQGMGLDMFLLTDVGQVFGDRSELSLGNLTTSYGVGIRLVGDRSFLGTLTLGWSEEDLVVKLRGDQAFEALRNVIFRGGSRVPSR